ncbi:MAG: WecB/TagA/CpsF family glycosyltransferase [Ilumatobacteraceae bacterium]|nr:WecB/TagA/CpsF family glycosyltransferase [Ilumatobacteraceae bacterium]
MQRQRLFGIEFVTGATIDEIADHLIAESVAPGTRWRSMVTPNVDHLVRYAKRPSELRVGQAADLALPDGMPIIWSSRLLGAPLAARLTGSDLFPRLWAKVISEERSIMLVVADQTIADALRLEYPSALCIVPPMIEVDDTKAIDAIAQQILETAQAQRLDFVMLGLSMPKHHRLTAVLTSRPIPAAGAPFLLLLGASAELHLGVQPRAPGWVQRAGLEWAQRLINDPRRLAKRYLLDDPAFIKLIFLEWRARHQRQPGASH